MDDAIEIKKHRGLHSGLIRAEHMKISAWPLVSVIVNNVKGT